MQRQAVEHGAHAVLADAEADVAAGKIAGLDVHRTLRPGVVRRSQVGRAAHQRGEARCERVQHLA